MWLRSPGSIEKNAAIVDMSGVIDENGYRVYDPGNGIRPAIWVEY